MKHSVHVCVPTLQQPGVENRANTEKFGLNAQKYRQLPPPNPCISEMAFSHRFQKVYTYPPLRNEILVLWTKNGENPENTRICCALAYSECPREICPFPPHGWSAPDGLPLLLRKQPIWAVGDIPDLMPVEQGLPWHPVATGLAGQAIPFIVAASHAHALPSAPFWFPIPAVLVASPALLCPSCLFAVLALVPSGVAPAFCVSVLLLPLSVGAPGCPCRAPPPVPPACPPVRGFQISVQHGLSRSIEPPPPEVKTRHALGYHPRSPAFSQKKWSKQSSRGFQRATAL